MTTHDENSRSSTNVRPSGFCAVIWGVIGGGTLVYVGFMLGCSLGLVAGVILGSPAIGMIVGGIGVPIVFIVKSFNGTLGGRGGDDFGSETPASTRAGKLEADSAPAGLCGSQEMSNGMRAWLVGGGSCAFLAICLTSLFPIELQNSVSGLACVVLGCAISAGALYTLVRRPTINIALEDHGERKEDGELGPRKRRVFYYTFILIWLGLGISLMSAGVGQLLGDCLVGETPCRADAHQV